VHPLLRILGIELLARAGRRLPGRVAPLFTALLLVAVNLLPLWAVLWGSAGMGDVFLIYWCENVVVWALGIVRIATAAGTGGPVVRTRSSSGPMSNAAFFALHYGIFTLVHGIFTMFMVVLVGLVGSLLDVLLIVLAILVSHVVSLGMNWFGRQERLVVSPGTAMVAPYPRMIALHIAIIGGFFFVAGGPGAADDGGQVRAVALLCGLKALIDLGFHLYEHRPRRVEDIDSLYGSSAP
jgi:hypothetical protein